MEIMKKKIYELIYLDDIHRLDKIASRLGICDTRVVEYSKLFVTYCTCCKACCKHNTQRVVNGVYLMFLNTFDKESRFIIQSFMMWVMRIYIEIG